MSSKIRTYFAFYVVFLVLIFRDTYLFAFFFGSNKYYRVLIFVSPSAYRD